MSRFLLPLLVAASALAAVPDSGNQQAAKDRLSRFQPLVGTWRGVGQPQRGSTKDSWVEEAEWGWNFDGPTPALVGKLPDGKYFRELSLTPADDHRFTITAKSAGGESVIYTGKKDEQDVLILTRTAGSDDLPQRISLRFAAGGDRLLLLLEKPAPGNNQFARLAEIGFTRQGSGFGKSATQRECVVTGGLGTIEVTHNGKTYAVCCTGCRDYFNANPDKVLAEYAARKKP
jgi:hypothetical protein